MASLKKRLHQEVNEWAVPLRYSQFSGLPDKRLKMLLGRFSPVSREPLCLVYQQGVLFRMVNV